MAIQNYTRRLTTAILDLAQPEVETFDPPTRKPDLRTKHEADRMIRCRDMAVRNFPKCEVGQSVGRRSSIYTLFSCTPLRYVGNVARSKIETANYQGQLIMYLGPYVFMCVCVCVCLYFCVCVLNKISPNAHRIISPNQDIKV